jgi:hypothetical protein
MLPPFSKTVEPAEVGSVLQEHSSAGSPEIDVKQTEIGSR